MDTHRFTGVSFDRTDGRSSPGDRGHVGDGDRVDRLEADRRYRTRVVGYDRRVVGR